MGTHEIHAERSKWLADALAAETDDCIVWPFRVDPANGYGRIRHEGAERYVHHVVLLRTGRATPSKGEDTRHLCGDRRCANKRHIVTGSRLENAWDREMHGRGRGGVPARRRLTDDDVRAIRASTDRQVDLAARFGIDQGSVSRIRNRIAWAHVE